MKTMTTIYNGNMKKLNDEELEMVNGGYILDRGYSSCTCRYVLIDDITGEVYCYSNTLSGIKNKEKAETNSQEIISLEDYRNIFGRDLFD